MQHPQQEPEPRKYAADNFLAVVEEQRTHRVHFIGTREECEEFMRNNIDEAYDLRYIKNGQLWHMSSYILEP